MTTDLIVRDSKFDVKKFANSAETFGYGAATVAGVVGVTIQVFTEQPAEAAPSPEVVEVITSATDTIPVLSGLCMAVFAAGLAPWAARTALSWMSSIMKGAI
jgi:protein-S-isoprenylcysteine O-methyltransferase Ste14